MFDQDDLFLGDNCNKFDIRKNGDIGDLSNLQGHSRKEVLYNSEASPTINYLNNKV